MIAEVLSAGASRPACANRGSTSTSKVFRSTSAPSLARASFRPDRARMDLGHQLPGLCDLFRRADRPEIRAGAAAGRSHDLHPRRARLRPDLGQMHKAHTSGGAG